MAYVEGFVAAVPAANKDAYCKHAADAAALLKEFGATRIVEAWGDDVPEGKVTDFRRAVKAEPDEVVVFSWLEYPDRAARDAANAEIMSDPRMTAMGAAMPFDGRRMIYGGFAALADGGPEGKLGYVDGSLVPVLAAAKEAYRDLAAKVGTVFREYGATRVVDAWGDDVPDGKITDYKGAVQATGEETVVFSWIEWPSKAARDEAWPKVMSDRRLAPEGGFDAKLFDGKRMIFGGFAPILDA